MLNSGARDEVASEPSARPIPEGVEFGQLARSYAQYGPHVLAHCTRLLRDAAAAEDALHEVFLRVRHHAGALPVASEMRPWLMRIATNYCLNELRNRSGRARLSTQLRAPDCANLEARITARSEIRRLLATLPAEARAVTLLTHVDGMLQREVAATLGVSRRTVVNHLSLARDCVETARRPELPPQRQV